MKGLLPTAEPGLAARLAVANLCRVVQHWPANSLMAVSLDRVGRGIRLGGWVNELAPEDWLDDVKYLLAPIAEVAATRVQPRRSAPRVELIPVAPTPETEAPLTGGDSAVFTVTSMPRAVLPSATTDPLWDLLSVFQTWAGASWTMLLSPASELEQVMCNDVWSRAFGGEAAVSWARHRGTALRARSFLHFDGESVPARVLAELAAITSQVEFHHLDSSERQELRNLDVSCLLARAVPQVAAQSITHLPAAGTRPIAGMKVLATKPVEVPYDQPAKPKAEAIKIGSCVDSDGCRRPVWQSAHDLIRHYRIVGASGAGKSTAIRSILNEWTESGFGSLVIDPHGTLADDLMGDLPNPEMLRVLDFTDTEKITPYNLFATDDRTEFEARLQIFTSILVDRWPADFIGPVWLESFSLIARGCWAIFGPRATLVMIFTILGSRDHTHSLAQTVSEVDPSLGAQIEQKLAGIRGNDNSSHWLWLASKGEEILGSQAMSRILASGAHAIDLREAIEESRTVLVNLALAELGERSAQLLGCMLIAEFRQAMLSRKDRENPFLLVIDEAHLFQYGPLASLLDEARKFGVGVVICHQRPQQLRAQLRDALAANAGSYLQLRISSASDAMESSLLLEDWPVGDLVRLPDLTAVAVISRDGVPSRPFSIGFDFFKRHARQLANKELRSWRTHRARAESERLLVAPHVDLELVTPQTLEESLKSTRERLRAQSRRDRLEETAHESAACEGVSVGSLPAWLRDE
ncbi:MAG TPA: type IV secretion system DNA-binding domain-containing protein [Propionicimonas sp.]|nr:type IV secretion system DNA-binding domain-containing protein [Propionicimonas sp.]